MVLPVGGNPGASSQYQNQSAPNIRRKSRKRKRVADASSGYPDDDVVGNGSGISKDATLENLHVNKMIEPSHTDTSRTQVEASKYSAEGGKVYEEQELQSSAELRPGNPSTVLRGLNGQLRTLRRTLQTNLGES